MKVIADTHQPPTLGRLQSAPWALVNLWVLVEAVTRVGPIEHTTYHAVQGYAWLVELRVTLFLAPGHKAPPRDARSRSTSAA